MKRLICPFEGCNGSVDIIKNLQRELPNEISGLLWHGFLCPKCSNFIGNFGVGGDPMLSCKKGKKGVWGFNNVKTGKFVKLKKPIIPNKYLKERFQSFEIKKGKV